MSLTTGRIQVRATIENFADVVGSDRGDIDESMVRRIEIPDAVVDTEVAGLLIPSNLIERLGLDPLRPPSASNLHESLERLGIGPTVSHWPVVLTVEGRECLMEVGAIPDHFPVIIGRIPLHAMDWVIDEEGGRLIGNPEHGGEEMFDVF